MIGPMSLDALREEVCDVNRRLPAVGLVTMHSGNASGLDRRSFPELPDDLRSWPDRQAAVELNEVVLKACHKQAAEWIPVELGHVALHQTGGYLSIFGVQRIVAEYSWIRRLVSSIEISPC